MEPFAAYHHLLRQNGWFIFNTFGTSTFCELAQVLESLGTAQAKASFINSLQLGEVLTKCGFEEWRIEEQTLRDYYSSARDLLVGIKKIGAQTAGFTLKEDDIFKLTGLYNTRYNHKGKVYASYQVLYGLARKEHPS